MSVIPSIDLTIAEDFSNASEVILKIRPQWKRAELKQKEFTAGITNKIMGFYHLNDPEWSDMILIRRYGQGTDKIVDRKAELRNIVALHKHGLSPPGYFLLKNGVVYGFAPGSTTDETTIKSEEIYPLVAETIAKIHSIDMSKEVGRINTHGVDRVHWITSRRNIQVDVSVREHCWFNNQTKVRMQGLNYNKGRVLQAIKHEPRLITDISNIGFDTAPCLFPKLESFFTSIPAVFSNARHQEMLQATGQTLDSLRKEVDGMREIVEKYAVPLFSFAHNDILLENVVYNQKARRVTLIDYEYGEFNYSFYDIGNHFAEMVGVGKINPENYPDREFQARWLRAYFKAKGIKEEELTEVYINDMVNQAQMFSLCGHLFWGIWALLQAEYSVIDFDFMEYGIMKLDEFFSRKDEFLAFTRY